MQIITEKNETVTPMQMAQALIDAEIQIDNPASSLSRSIQKTLTGKEQRDVIECGMFNADEFQELGEHLLAYAYRIKKEEMYREDKVKHYASKES